jgi:hypothetical protein
MNSGSFFLTTMSCLGRWLQNVPMIMYSYSMVQTIVASCWEAFQVTNFMMLSLFRIWLCIYITSDQCCGSESESEIIRMFWLDPNPKKSSDSDTDSDSDTVAGWTFLWKIKNQTLERGKSYVFLFKIFFLSQNTYESN